MKNRERLLGFLIFSLLVYPMMYGTGFSMRGHTSYIKVSSGGTFALNQPITGFDGKLVKESGGVIGGTNTITFDGGILENEGNRLFLQAVLTPGLTFTIALDGTNSLLRADPSQIISCVSISGTGNRIEGQPLFDGNNDIVLTDTSTGLTMAVQSELNANIRLNGGTVTLEDTLRLKGDKQLAGAGSTVNLNGHAFILGGTDQTWSDAIIWQNLGDLRASANLTLDANQAISGDTGNINFNGNWLDLNGYDLTISVSVCNVRDTHLRGLGNGKIIFTDGASGVYFSNVSVEMDNDYTLTCGNIYVDGPTTFIVKDHTWTFDSNSTLTVDGVTLWIDSVAAASSGRVAFNSSANLSLLNSGTIRYVSDNMESRVEYLESCYEDIQTCCSILDDSCYTSLSRLDSIDNRLDNLSILVELGTIYSRLDELDSCCEEVRSDIENPEQECVRTIIIKSDLVMTSTWLPAANEAVMIKFCPQKCTECGTAKPKVSVQKSEFPSGVGLSSCSRIIFSGEGILELEDSVTVTLGGNSISNWPEFILEDGALIKLEDNATVTFGGEGKFIVRKGASVLLDNPAHLIFGDSSLTNEIVVLAEFGGMILVLDQDSLITFHQGTYDLLFENNSILGIEDGTVELNTLNGQQSGGLIRNMHFEQGSLLYVLQTACQTSGLLRFSPNDFGLATDWDNRTGEVRGHGDLQYITFDNGAVDINSITQIQDNRFAIAQPMDEIFMNLSYISKNSTIGAYRGTRPNPARCGQFVGFCPSRDGSYTDLPNGAHSVSYCRSNPSLVGFDLIIGYDSNNNRFSISCGE